MNRECSLCHATLIEELMECDVHNLTFCMECFDDEHDGCHAYLEIEEEDDRMRMHEEDNP